MNDKHGIILMKGRDFMNDNPEKIYVDKFKYEMLKTQEKENQQFKMADFCIKVYRGAVLHPSHPNYNDERVKIEIFSIDFITLNNYSIQIDGKNYNINSQNLFNKIKKFVRDNIDVLISWSKKQTNSNLDNNAYEGGIGRTIIIKYGQLIININGQVRDIGNLCDEFINELKKLIINEGEKTDEDYIKESFENIEIKPLTEEDKEFEKYCKLYEEKFGKRAYIAEPSGTKEKTIEAIKTCLEKNEDLLDKILYPNFDEDMENGNLY